MSCHFLDGGFMFKETSYVISFLTILPSKGAPLDIVAKYMHLFPIAGILLGVVIGSIGFGLSNVLDPLIAGMLIVACIVIITGLHHTDGLADFADGVMAKGTLDTKISAMRDHTTGTAGISALVLYLIGLVAVISLSSGYELFRALLVSEVLAKFAMVLLASMGNAIPSSSCSSFVTIMRDRRRLVFAGAITLLTVILVGQLVGLIMFGIVITMVLILFSVSMQSFGGVAGDIFGATNELTRLAALLVFVSI